LVFKNGAIILPGSSAPEFRGDAARIDPEEAFVSALASCHMLSFLAICARKRITVDRYDDDATGHLEKNAQGKLWVARVVLRPQVVFSAQTIPTQAELLALHHQSHDACFIANSVKTDVAVEPHSAALR